MKAKVIKTGEVLTIQDYGRKVYPRYWGNDQGYCPEELNFNIVLMDIVDGVCQLSKGNHTCSMSTLCCDCIYENK